MASSKVVGAHVVRVRSNNDAIYFHHRQCPEIPKAWGHDLTGEMAGCNLVLSYMENKYPVRGAWCS